MRLIAKIILAFNYHICSGFGISQQSYRSPSEHYGGTRQGNLPSGKVCKVQSCYIIREIEGKDIEYKLIILIQQKKIDRIAIAFVDDTNFYSNGDCVQENIKNII